jgi:ribosome-associated protein
VEPKKKTSAKRPAAKRPAGKSTPAGKTTSAARARGAASAATGAKKKPAVPASARRASVPPPSPAAKPDRTQLRRESAKKTALAIALAALDKKADRVEIVDIGEKVDYADYLVVMTGRSDRQVVAIAQGIEAALEQAGNRTVGLEGLPQGHWVLIDYGDVIVHVFLDEARKYYDLEGLWMDAPRVPTPSFVPPPPAAEG